MKFPSLLKKTLVPFLLLLLVSSCVTRKDMVYFQENKEAQVNFFPDENISIKPGDLLTIRVSAAEQEAAQPFNLVKSVASLDRVGGQVELETYMVSQKGTIEFPVVGILEVAGLTNYELADKIKAEIREYVTDAIVNVRILNFQITVLGEVNNAGTFKIEDDHISLSNALGLAGDLTIWGKRDNILVMREENGKKVEAYLDLTDSKVVTSPYYYLRQNDVVYVEPKASRRQASSGLGVAANYLSFLSVIISLVIVFTR